MATNLYGPRRKIPIALKKQGRNLGFAVGETMANYNPTITGIIKGNRDARNELKSSMNAIETGNITRATKNFRDYNQSKLNATINSLSSGKWYTNNTNDNTDSFDLNEDWGDDTSSAAEATQNILSQNEENSKRVVNSVNQVGSNISKAYGYATAKNAEIIAKTTISNTKALYDLNSKGFNQVTNVLLNMQDTNIKLASAIGEPLSVHVQNSAIFYTKTTETLNNINKNIQTLVDRTDYMDKGPGGKLNKNRKSANRFAMGGFDRDAYFDMVKENAKEMGDIVLDALGFKGKQTQKYGRNLSPMAQFMAQALDFMLPKMFKDSMKNLNQSLGLAIRNGMTKGSKWARQSDNPLINLLGALLLPNDRLKTRTDTANYNKGPVPFDGVTRKSIVEVIPTYLSKIYAALGGEEKYYDYQTGRFMSIPQIQKKHDDDIKYAALQAGGDFRKDVMSRMSSPALKQEVDNFFIHAFMLGETYDTIEQNIDNQQWLKRFGLSKRAAKVIVNEIKTARREKRNSYAKFQADVSIGRSKYTNKMNQEEVNGYSLHNYTNNGFNANFADKHDKTQLDYLRSIAQMVGAIYAQNGGTTSGIKAYDVDYGRIRKISKTTGSGAEKANNEFKRYREDELTEDELIKTWGYTDSQIDKYLNRKEIKGFAAKIGGEAKDKAKKAGEGKFKDNESRSKFGRAVRGAKDFVSKPFEAASQFINVLTAGINDLFWGADGGSGLISRLKSQTDSWFTTLKDRLREKVAEKWDQTGIKDAVKSEWGNVKRFMFGEKNDDSATGWLYGGKSGSPLPGKSNYEKLGFDKAVYDELARRYGKDVADEYMEEMISSIDNTKKATAKAAKVARKRASAWLKLVKEKGTDAAASLMVDSIETGKTIKNSGAMGVVTEGANILGGGIAQFLRQTLTGTDQKKDTKAVTTAISDAFKEMGNAKGAMAIGAMGGAGVSLLTGAIVGPLAGAAIGAGVGLVAKSERVQNWLFGELDEDTGERKGGFIPKNIQDKLTMSPEFKEKLKAAAPRMAAGGIAGLGVSALLGGPFGVAGNLIVGAGLGYLSTSDKFHEYMFGENGLAYTLHDKIFTHVDNLFHNMGNRLVGMGKKLSINLLDYTKKAGKALYEKIKNSDKSALGRIAGGVLRTGERLGGAAINTIGAPIKALSTHTMKKNLAAGYDVYGRKADGSKGILTARERNQARQQLGVFGDKYSDFDTILGNVKTETDLADLQHALDVYYKDNNGMILDADGNPTVSAADYFKNKGIDLSRFSKGGIATLKDLAKSEGHTRDWSKQIKNEEAMYRFNMQQYLRDLHDWFLFGKQPTVNSNKAHHSSENERNIQMIPDKNGVERYYEIGEDGKKRQIKKKDALSVLAEQEEKKKQLETNGGIFGQIQGTVDENGNFKPNMGDTGTKEALKRRDQFFNAISNIPIIGTGINKMGNLFSDLKGKLFGDKENGKKGLLGNIFDILKENPVTKSIAEFIGGTKLGAFASKLFKGATLKTVIKGLLSDAAIVGLLGAIFTGKADDIAKDVTNGAYGSDKVGTKDDVRYDPKTGAALTKDPNTGKWYNPETGEEFDDSQVAVRKGGADALSAYAIKGTARQLLTRQPTLAGALIKKTHLYNGATKLGNTKVGNLFKKSFRLNDKVDDMVKANPTKNRALLEKASQRLLTSNIDDALAGLAKNASKIPLIGSKLGPAVAKACEELAPKLGKLVASTPKMAAKASTFMTKAVPVILIATIIADFTTGYQDARSTLGILKKPTQGQRIISGLLRVVKNLIPFVGPLIPDKLVVDVFCKYIAPVFGLTPEELLKDQDEAQATVDAYNAENGTDLTVSDYLKQVEGDYTWTEKVGNWGKTVIGQTKGFFSNIKDKGIVDAWKESNLGDTLAAPIKTLNEGFGFTKLIELARKGELKEFISYGTDREAESPLGKMAKQIPLTITKVSLLPTALVGWTMKPITKKILGIIDKAKTTFNLMQQAEAEGEAIIKGDGSLSDYLKPPKNMGEDEGLDMLAKGTIMSSKLMALPIMVTRKVFGKVGKAIGNFFDKTKNMITNTFQDTTELNVKMLEGDLKGLWNFSSTTANDSEDMGSLGGFINGVVNMGSRITLTPFTAVSWVGHKIGDLVKNKFNSIKSDISSLGDSFKAIIDATKEGDYKKVMGVSYTAPNSGGLGVLLQSGFGISKIILTLAALIKKVINPIGDALNDVIENVKDSKAGQFLSNTGKNIKEKAKGLWEKAKDFVNGDGSGLPSGGSSGFVSQRDPRYANTSYAGSTFGEKGCGPAVAAMAARSMGKDLSVNDAVRASKGYQNSAGTSMDYFGSVLGSKGISTEVISGGSSNDLYNRIANGNKVILLGRDPSNTSKDNSPFGPNNHYVLATGLDGAGNIKINDPELRGTKSYSPEILKSAAYGISGGGSDYDTKTAQQVWAFLRSKGFSAAAAAGIMGNLYQESGVNPKSIQGNGNGPAAGIAQWENYNTKSSRWKELYNYAAKKGKDWTDLGSQLNFLYKELTSSDIKQRMEGKIAPSNLSSAGAKPMSFDQFMKTNDIDQAMRLFEGAFERAGTPNFPRRLEAAKAYYKLYEGKNYTYTGASDSSSSSSTGSTGTKFSSVLQAAANIGSVFSQVLGRIFNPDSSDSEDASLTGDNVQDVDDPELGPVPTGKGNAGQKKIIRYANSILGKDQYSQGANRTQVGNGYSDCSSFAQWAWKKGIGVDPGSWTGAMEDNIGKTLVKVDKADSSGNPHKNKLEAGDLMMYYDKSGSNIGHVELYDGNGNSIGHGSGVGPKKKALETYISDRLSWNSNAKYAYSLRYKDIAKFGNSGKNGMPSNVGAGSSIPALLGMSAGGSGLALPSGGKSGITPVKAPTGNNSSITMETTRMLNQLSRRAQSSSGTVSADLVNKLLQAITALLSTIADNTAPIEKIYNALVTYTKGNNTTTKHEKGETTTTSTGTDVDENFTALVGVLAQLAKG